MKTTTELQERDPKFDFENAYKINAYTLINFFVAHISHDAIVLTIDGDRQILAPSRGLYTMTYREWENPNAFSLCKNILGRKDEMYWTSKERAEAWFSKYVDLKMFGYTPLTEEQAYATLREYLNDNVLRLGNS